MPSGKIRQVRPLGEQLFSEPTEVGVVLHGSSGMVHHHREVAPGGHVAEDRMLVRVGHLPLTMLADQAIEPIDKMEEKLGGLVGVAVEATL